MSAWGLQGSRISNLQCNLESCTSRISSVKAVPVLYHVEGVYLLRYEPTFFLSVRVNN
jgi:hypothetical protein